MESWERFWLAAGNNTAFFDVDVKVEVEVKIEVKLYFKSIFSSRLFLSLFVLLSSVNFGISFFSVDSGI